MKSVRALALLAVLGAGIFAACGGGGAGPSSSPYGATNAPTQAPALGTNKPERSGDPYSDTGY
jgi:hypothetical protein